MSQISTYSPSRSNEGFIIILPITEIYVFSRKDKPDFFFQLPHYVYILRNGEQKGLPEDDLPAQGKSLNPILENRDLCDQSVLLLHT